MLDYPFRQAYLASISLARTVGTLLQDEAVLTPIPSQQNLQGPERCLIVLQGRND